MNNGTQIKIDPEIMTRVAGIIDAERGKIESLYNSIYSVCQDLRQNWEGTGADVYIKTMTEISDVSNVNISEGKMTAGTVVNFLKEYVHDLNAIAEEFKAREAEVTSGTEALSTDVFHV